MFTTQDYFKATTDYFSAFPKNVDEVKTVFEKTKRVYDTETENVKSVISTYSKASTGNASINEISDANKKVQDLCVTARFAAVVAVPGAIFALPVINTMAKEFSINLIPSSVEKEFNL